jgi:uncharacterized protein (TIGR02246 family)
MKRRNGITAAGLLGLAACLTMGAWYRTSAQPKTGEGPAAAAIRKSAGEFVKAFNAGDAKAVARFWTEEGEYIGPDGDKIVGRAEIEKTYVEYFKKNPKAQIEVKVDSIKPVGKHTALEEGTLTLTPAPEKAEIINKYSALHVLEDDGVWRMASVREWTPHPGELLSLNDVEWLIGDWSAKNEDMQISTRYTWDEAKTFIHCHFSVKKDGKVVASGLQIIGKDPQGTLRSWLFEKSGTFGESVWEKDGTRWVLDSAGVLPNGSAVTATTLLIPMGKDAFTWQSVDRTAAGTPLPNTAPLKVTRVQK